MIDTGRLLPAEQWDGKRTQVVLVGVGSFSPITFMHLRLFEMAKDHLEQDCNGQFQVIGGFVSPVNDRYEKAGLIPAEHRAAMCRLALAGHGWLQLDEWEAQQPAWQCTISVLRSFSQRLEAALHRGVRVILVSGSDLILSFQVPGLWAPQDQETIAGSYGLAVVERAGSDLAAYLLLNPILYKHRGNVHLIRQHVLNDVSSTKVRLLVSRGLSIRYLLPDPVIHYIHHHALYT